MRHHKGVVFPGERLNVPAVGGVVLRHELGQLVGMVDIVAERGHQVPGHDALHVPDVVDVRPGAKHDDVGTQSRVVGRLEGADDGVLSVVVAAVAARENLPGEHLSDTGDLRDRFNDGLGSGVALETERATGRRVQLGNVYLLRPTPCRCQAQQERDEEHGASVQRTFTPRHRFPLSVSHTGSGNIQRNAGSD